ncbi:MAG: thiamine phosphate synthase [Rhizobiaceae bacterium]|nr:thiamine phosphate synthase [Rhizobiaceae bacterium]
MPEATEPNRCRLVLIWPDNGAPDDAAARLSAALAGGDVASLILPQYGLGEDAFQALCEKLVPVAQQAGVAAVVAGDTRIAGRLKADGVHVDGGPAALADVIDRFASRMMVGAGGAKSRDDALNLGECQPDYLFFGRFGFDNKPEPHPRNLSLASWWAEMVSIPCVVLGGSDTDSIAAVAATGAEFVALSAAVFGEGRDPAEEVARANALLDSDAPRFEAA